MRLWNAIAETIWAITPDALSTIIAVSQRQGEDLEALSARLGRPLDNTSYTRVMDRIAIISARGPMFRYANLFSDVSGATSYQRLATDLGAALDDPAIDAVLLDIDSPGGAVNGAGELADIIHAARKPIHAYIGHEGTSAAYWLAAATRHITLAPTAMAGSIGVRMVIRSAGQDGAEYEFISSQSPHKRMDPGKPDDQALIQQVIDDTAQVFVDSVARYRNVDAATVIADFGQGGVLVGARALEAGMVDRLGGFDAALVHLKSQIRGNTMKDDKINQAEAEAVAAQPVVSDAQRAEIRAAAVSDERARIGAIIQSEQAKTRADLAHKIAFSTDMSVEMALELLSAAPEQAAPVPAPAEQKSAAGSQFEQYMQQINPPIEPDPKAEQTDLDQTVAGIIKHAKVLANSRGN